MNYGIFEIVHICSGVSDYSVQTCGVQLMSSVRGCKANLRLSFAMFFQCEAACCICFIKTGSQLTWIPSYAFCWRHYSLLTSTSQYNSASVFTIPADYHDISLKSDWNALNFILSSTTFTCWIFDAILSMDTTGRWFIRTSVIRSFVRCCIDVECHCVLV